MPSMQEATTAEAAQPRRAIRLVAGVVARVVAACGFAFALNAAALWVVGAPLAATCRASGGTPCLTAALLSVALLSGVPAVYGVVSARAAALGALAEGALRTAAGSGWLLEPLAGLVVSRLATPARLATRHLDRGLDDHPALVRGGLRLFLLASGLGKLSRSAAYVKAAAATDATAAVADLLARDLREAAARRRAAFPWWLVAVNVAALAGAWAALR